MLSWNGVFKKENEATDTKVVDNFKYLFSFFITFLFFLYK
jgi:hypothetical protein